MAFQFAHCSRFAVVALLLALFACADDSTSPPPPEPDPVTRESANATSSVVGPAGGTLQTTASDGTVYTLTIPANALATGKTVTMTPVTAIDGYPLASGIVGGVELKPSGTLFTVPVTLEIETPRAPGPGLTAVAILFSGNGPSFEPSFAGVGAGSFIVPMRHFSGGTVAFANAQQLASLVSPQAVQCLAPAIQAASEHDVNDVFAIFRSCFVSDVLPSLEGATNDRQLTIAIGKFSVWKTDARAALDASLFVSFNDAAETQQFYDALVGKLQTAIENNNDRCQQDESLAALASVLFWQTQAARYGLDTMGNLLDRDTVLSNLCAHAVVDQLVLPIDLQVGVPQAIDIEFGLLFNAHQNSMAYPFEVHLVGDGVDIQHPAGFTDTQGKYTSVITATREGEVSITASACLVYPGTQTASDVCVEDAATTAAIARSPGE